MSERLKAMPFEGVYQALVAKVERKGGAARDVERVIEWMMGYTSQDLQHLCQAHKTYGDFIIQAPAYHPDRTAITGKICGVEIETIKEPWMQEVRRLDKLVDWLAKGKTVEEIIARYATKD